jgi:hypothetical protein
LALQKHLLTTTHHLEETKAYFLANQKTLKLEFPVQEVQLKSF